MLTLEEEIHINMTSTFRIIGLTLETRPDYITMTTIRMYRRWGVTRMQIGVQHYDDEILEKNKRSLKSKRRSIMNEDHISITDYTISAIRMLKQCGFKVVVHLMPDMYGSTPEKDLHMFHQAITRSDFQFDDVKIYPTAVCKSESGDIIVTSELARMYADGTYVPYAEKNLQDLINVIKYYKINCPPWVRIQRLVRDIPGTSIEAGYDKRSNLRQMIQDEMKKEGTQCQCIRCLEIDHEEIVDPKVVVYRYLASEGIEYHIQIEMFDHSNKLNYIMYQVKDYLSQMFLGKKLYYSGCLATRKHVIGFCRLRIDNNPGNKTLKELANCALIREVHVYGSSLCIGINKTDNTTQHRGFGQLLVKTAEDIVVQEENNAINKMAIIAGVGTREYYKNKCNYTLEGTYMTKDLKMNIRTYNLNKFNKLIYKIFILSYIIVVALYLYLYHL
jgi:histone acetyltransferase (RNA polymerase elongator complex component)